MTVTDAQYIELYDKYAALSALYYRLFDRLKVVEERSIAAYNIAVDAGGREDLEEDERREKK